MAGDLLVFLRGMAPSSAAIVATACLPHGITQHAKHRGSARRFDADRMSLQMEADDPRLVRTVDAIERELLRGKHVVRYASEGDFGVASTIR
jgi:hypothetical protein